LSSSYNSYFIVDRVEKQYITQLKHFTHAGKQKPNFKEGLCGTN